MVIKVMISASREVRVFFFFGTYISIRQAENLVVKIVRTHIPT